MEKERSDDVAVDVCCVKKPVRGNLDLYFFDTSFCFVQSLAPLLLNEILFFIY